MAQIVLRDSYLNQDSNLKKTNKQKKKKKIFFVFAKSCRPGNTLIAEMPI